MRLPLRKTRCVCIVLALVLMGALSALSAPNSPAHSVVLGVAAQNQAASNTTVRNNVSVLSDSVSLGSNLNVEGVVTTQKGPLASAPVALHMGDITLAHTQTDASGKYTFSTPVGLNYFPAVFSDSATVYTVAEPTNTTFPAAPSAGTSVPVNAIPIYVIIAVVTGLMIFLLYIYGRGIGGRRRVKSRHAVPRKRFLRWMNIRALRKNDSLGAAPQPKEVPRPALFVDIKALNATESAEELRKRIFFDTVAKYNTEKNLLAATAVLLTILTNVCVLQNIPILRPVFGFTFLTVLPGVLLFQIVKIKDRGVLEKIILCWGLSIAFVMFATLAINSVLPLLGNTAPLTIPSFLFSLDLVVLALIVLAHRAGSNTTVKFPRLEIRNSQLSLYIVPLFFPLLAVIGSYVMNVTDNNAVLLALLFIMPLYVAFICLRKGKCPTGLYPLLIFSMSLTIPFLLALRSQHLVGVDVHFEFYQLTSILNDGQMLFGAGQSLSPLYAGSASILLPVAYQLTLGINPELLYNTLFSLLFLVVPLAVYAIARKYVNERYALIAAFVYISQWGFLWANTYSRATIAVLFFTLAFMVLFSSYKHTTTGLALFIVFAISGMMSHYTTAFLFIAMTVMSVILIIALPKRDSFFTRKNVVVLAILGSVIVLWYTLTKSSVLAQGNSAVEKITSGISDFFSTISLGDTGTLLGSGIVEKTIVQQLEFILTWAIIACLAIGILMLIVKRKEMTTFYPGYKKPAFLRARFDADYSVMALAASVILVLALFAPYVSTFYGLQRTYFFVMTLLSVFFVVGTVTLSGWAATLMATISTRRRKTTTSDPKIDGSRRAAARMRPYLAVLLALAIVVPYFLCVTGALYAVAGMPRNMVLSSQSEQYFTLHINDGDAAAAKWIPLFGRRAPTIATADQYGGSRLISQAHLSKIGDTLFEHNSTRADFIYLYYYNVVEKKYVVSGTAVNIDENSSILLNSSKVLDAGGAQVYL